MAIYIVSTAAHDAGCELDLKLSQLSHLFTKVDSVDHAIELIETEGRGKVPMVTYAYDIDQVKDLVLRLQDMPELKLIVLMGQAGSAAAQSPEGMGIFSLQHSSKVN